MFTKKTEPSGLSLEIDAFLLAMQKHDKDSPEYATMIDQLKKLYPLKEYDTSPRGVSPDTLAIIAGNLAGILIIVGYEKANVVASKAASFVLKLR